MAILAILVLIHPFKYVDKQAIFIINKKRMSITIGAVMNLVLCLVLIYFYGIYVLLTFDYRVYLTYLAIC